MEWAKSFKWTYQGKVLLKDPQFFTSSVFLRSPERAETVAKIMGCDSSSTAWKTSPERYFSKEKSYGKESIKEAKSYSYT